MNAPTDTIEDLKQQLLQLNSLRTSGVLSEAQFEEARAKLERRMVDRVMADSSATPAVPGMSTRAAAAAYAATAAASAAPASVAPARPSALLLTGLTVAVLAIAIAGYAWKGFPGAVRAGAEAQAAAEGNAASPEIGLEQIAAMTDKLAERLKERPDDVEGWTMLARSYSVLGRHPEALKAYEKAISLRQDDPTLLADYADSMAVTQNSDLSGEPMKLVERALQIDPNNLKALYLAGTQAFNTQKYADAVKFWEKMVAASPPGNAFSQQVEPAIAEARKLAGMPPASGAAVANASVSGTVTLSAALAGQAQPEDTLFVFARAAEGSRMPLAILRKQVKDLPLTFKLDDSMAMSPSSSLSGAGSVIVGARISKSGNAMPQPGDLLGQSAPVSVGSSGLQIEITQAVSP